LRLDGMSGLEVLDAVRASGASLVTVFLSGHGDIPAAVKAMQNGAFDWLEKPCSDDVLIQKIQLALAYADVLAQQKEELLDAQALWQKLTPREKTIAHLVSEGKSSKIIARELEPIEPRTVDTHRANIFSKLGVSNSHALGGFIRQYKL
jgi:FixJ family two-component response regulator